MMGSAGREHGRRAMCRPPGLWQRGRGAIFVCLWLWRSWLRWHVGVPAFAGLLPGPAGACAVLLTWAAAAWEGSLAAPEGSPSQLPTPPCKLPCNHLLSRSLTLLVPLVCWVVQGELPDEETIKKLIRKGTIGGKFVPVTCGTAFKNKGVQPLLDAGAQLCDAVCLAAWHAACMLLPGQ